MPARWSISTMLCHYTGTSLRESEPRQVHDRNAGRRPEWRGASTPGKTPRELSGSIRPGCEPIRGHMHRGSVSSVAASGPEAVGRIACLKALEQKILWLAVWMIHHANHLREKRDGLKVGGHQASSASVVTLMTALYFDVLTPDDRVAVKPHASPVYHAIQYLLGRQSREKLEKFRAFGGAQSYPSRTKDSDDVDFSTGSVGLGVAITSFAALVQDYLRLKGLVDSGAPRGRMIALAGDAEFDEGNIFEALFEGWKHDIANVWWIIDYNRQSLDAVCADRLYRRYDTIFADMGWNVVTLKYGSLLERVFERRGGDARPPPGA